MNSKEEFNFENEIKKFVEENKPYVSILTPCYNAQCYVNYVYCLIKTKELFDMFNIKLKIDFCKNDSLITRARNNLLSKAMNNKDITHFMFIDNDITWDPINIIKLLISQKPIVGGVYPLKKYHWNKLNIQQMNEWISKKNNSDLKEFVHDDTYIQNNLLQYNTNFIEDNMNIQNNLMEVKNVATGFMMIKREVIEKMQLSYSSTKYTDDNDFLSYALFDGGVVNGKYLSEDWMFCDRWKKIGGSLWIDVSINLTHTGIEDFQGSLISSLL